MPMEAFKENDTGGRILGGGATGGEWTAGGLSWLHLTARSRGAPPRSSIAG